MTCVTYSEWEKIKMMYDNEGTVYMTPGEWKRVIAWKPEFIVTAKHLFSREQDQEAFFKRIYTGLARRDVRDLLGSCYSNDNGTGASYFVLYFDRNKPRVTAPFRSRIEDFMMSDHNISNWDDVMAYMKTKVKLGGKL